MRYYLHASIDLVGWVDPASRRAITVLPSSPMPTPAALMPASSERMGVRLHKCSFCFCRCCKLGAVDITLRTGRQSYAIGERIDIPVSTVVNHSKDELEATLVLVKYILLTQTGRVCSGQKHGSHRQVAVLTTARVTPGQTLRDCCRPEPIMPPTAPSFFGSRGRAWGGEPVTWTYALELHVRPVRRAFGETISAEIPVLVSAAPPYPYQVPHGSDGSVLPVDVSALDPWSIASKAATAGSASHPGQLLSGAEDTMGMAKLVAMGTPVVVATPVEAKQIEDQSQLVYQPFELQWPQSLDQWPTPPPPNSSKDKSSTFSNLEEALRASNDRRTTVGEWVNNSPTAASMLTPKQVATVLSGASLSLEQPSIARELSLGLTGHLKCAHVRAALDACPFAKTDVALAMAPFVTDPDKRSEVLTMLVSFDRQRVEDVMMRGTGN